MTGIVLSLGGVLRHLPQLSWDVKCSLILLLIGVVA